MARSLSVCMLSALLAVVALALGAQAEVNGRIDMTKPVVTGKEPTSLCAKDCIAKATQLGYAKVANQSMACFLPYKGKRLSSADCCDQAELLFGRHGSLASCLCCKEFAEEMLKTVPLDQVDTTHDEYLTKMDLCRVPLVGTPGCSAKFAKERAPLQPGSNGPPFSTLDPSRPLAGQLNLTGFYPIFGFPTRFTSTLLAAQGKEAIAKGQMSQIKVVGASDFYNNYMTGFMMLIERETPRYATPPKPTIPDLPKEYKDDVAWVANLRRGPYPNVNIKGRPAENLPKVTDPLQNGEIANMSPGVVFAGRVPSLNYQGP